MPFSAALAIQFIQSPVSISDLVNKFLIYRRHIPDAEGVLFVTGVVSWIGWKLRGFSS